MEALLNGIFVVNLNQHNNFLTLKRFYGNSIFAQIVIIAFILPPLGHSVVVNSKELSV